MTYELRRGNCLDVLKTLSDNSIDSIVTDPPYGLSFMGKKWDYDVPSQEIWVECLRVLKPGGHLLAFAGTRTQHRMAVRIEDAGFEIRDMIAWVYGSGFPKSHDVSKAIDKAAGAERTEVIGTRHRNAKPFDDESGWNANSTTGDHNYTAPATEAARKWQGWGTALKPALEPITVARKPLIGTVAENVLAHGTGALNIDGCRVGDNAGWSYPNGRGGSGWHGRDSLANNLTEPMAATQGRWPANLIHDGSDEVVGLFPADKQGSAARFFYAPKASKRDRDEGLDGFEIKKSSVGDNRPGGDFNERLGKTPGVRANVHPTVKPTDLMRYLCRLVTPPNGVILDPFMGSGSTGKAAMLEGFQFIGIEREAEYVEIARARIENATQEQKPDNKQLDLI